CAPTYAPRPDRLWAERRPRPPMRSRRTTAASCRLAPAAPRTPWTRSRRPTWRAPRRARALAADGCAAGTSIARSRRDYSAPLSHPCRSFLRLQPYVSAAAQSEAGVGDQPVASSSGDIDLKGVARDALRLGNAAVDQQLMRARKHFHRVLIGSQGASVHPTQDHRDWLAGGDPRIAADARHFIRCAPLALVELRNRTARNQRRQQRCNQAYAHA